MKNMMHSITFTCEVITPMFLAGADGQTPELRPASIKGAMRFWWRAMHGNLGLDELKKKEAMIFGGAGDNQGRSKVIVRILAPQPSKSSIPLPVRLMSTYKKYNINGLDYMAYGMLKFDRNERKNILIRSYIGPGESFRLCLVVEKQYSNEILSALYLLSEYGGLGAKSRNGYGGFRIVEGNEHLVNVAVENYQNEPSSFCCLSKHTKIDEKKGFTHWKDAIFFLGESYQIAREKIDSKHVYENRVFISHPIIDGTRGEVKETILRNGRHAKPYFMNVSKDNDGKYSAKRISMPYNFLEGHPEYNKKYLNRYWEAIESFNKKLGLNE